MGGRVAKTSVIGWTFFSQEDNNVGWILKISALNNYLNSSETVIKNKGALQPKPTLIDLFASQYRKLKKEKKIHTLKTC